jgi:RNA polymerase sigma-70 factor (ECF subfamily)
MTISTPRHPATAEPEELILRAQEGQREACEELAHRHRKAAYLFALQLLGNPDDALDVAQEAMLQFFVSLHRFQPGRSVRPWLFTIVRNKARDFWRRRRARKTESLDNGVTDLSLAMVDRSSNPEGDALLSELQQRVWRALSKLPATKREILVLRDFHDLSYNEIARVLSIPVGTVMSRLHAARKGLREVYLHQEQTSRRRRNRE